MDILSIVGITLTMCGTILVYDARPITKKVFGFGDQNEATLGLKIVGFMTCIIGGLMMVF